MARRIKVKSAIRNKTGYKNGQMVYFRNMVDPEDNLSRMRVVEDRGNRLYVADQGQMVFKGTPFESPTYRVVRKTEVTKDVNRSAARATT